VQQCIEKKDRSVLRMRVELNRMGKHIVSQRANSKMDSRRIIQISMCDGAPRAKRTPKLLPIERE
jgi:hypothetical protein